MLMTILYHKVVENSMVWDKFGRFVKASGRMVSSPTTKFWRLCSRFVNSHILSTYCLASKRCLANAVVWRAKGKQERYYCEGAYLKSLWPNKIPKSAQIFCRQKPNRTCEQDKKITRDKSSRVGKVCVYASSIAPTGHCAAQAPQSTQRSAAIS